MVSCVYDGNILFFIFLCNIVSTLNVSLNKLVKRRSISFPNTNWGSNSGCYGSLWTEFTNIWTANWGGGGGKYMCIICGQERNICTNTKNPSFAWQKSHSWKARSWLQICFQIFQLHLCAVYHSNLKRYIQPCLTFCFTREELFFKIKCHVICWKSASVSEEHVTSIFRVKE
jgi:hypothetical protein